MRLLPLLIVAWLVAGCASYEEYEHYPDKTDSVQSGGESGGPQ